MRVCLYVWIDGPSEKRKDVVVYMKSVTHESRVQTLQSLPKTASYIIWLLFHPPSPPKEPVMQLLFHPPLIKNHSYCSSTSFGLVCYVLDPCYNHSSWSIPELCAATACCIPMCTLPCVCLFNGVDREEPVCCLVRGRVRLGGPLDGARGGGGGGGVRGGSG